MEENKDQQKADREGMIQVNDLVYKLEPDMSVAVNRTHKNHFFQQPEYKNNQPAICILNSGADYIDTRRSFLHFEVKLECKAQQIQAWDKWTNDYDKECAQNFNDNLLVHGYFGPNGSILNLIETVTVTTRSGDELSRVQDLALVSNMTLPLIYGEDWKSTVGAMMGFGEGVFGRNDKGRVHPAAQRRFSIPLYLLSPLFQYGRLMPSMLMSGLRILITWKSATKAFAQYVTRYPKTVLNYGGYVSGMGFNDTFHFNAQESAPGQASGSGVNFVQFDGSIYSQPIHDPGYVAISNKLESDLFTSGRAYYESTHSKALVPFDGHRGDGKAVQLGEQDIDMTWPVDTLHFETNPAKLPVFDRPDYWGTGAESYEPPEANRVWFPLQMEGGTMVPGYKYKGPPIDVFPDTGEDEKDYTTRTSSGGVYNIPYVRRKYYKNPDFVDAYTISGAEFSLCSVQLSDAIQRTLNEYSAVNGLEIVYTDYDMTTSPIQATTNGTSVYTEVRKSASRALMAFARIIPNYNKDMIQRTCDSNASVIQYNEDIGNGGRGWLDYQWQLGSLYFPQQKIIAKTAFDMGTLAYSHTLDAFDRFAGTVSCMLKLSKGSGGKDKSALTRTQKSANWAMVPGAAPPDLLSQERLYILGQPGTFQGGGEVIAVSLERSSLFNLSGIPINNSRVLALRGNFSSVPTSYCNSHTLHIFLKYVKLARIFLNNVEVEQ